MNPPLTAARAGLWLCHVCHQLNRAGPPATASGRMRCARCGASLHHRKPNSIARTWALVLAAFILYIPANLLPIMTVVSLGAGEPDTILSGVMQLIAANMWPLALLVFFASIVVPMLKLFVLIYLLLSVQRKSRWRPRDRTALYRLTEAVGRWSMLDIFVIAILVALVKFGAVATIETGPGATAFAAVVVITMFAAMSFDPRLIWDAMEPYNDLEKPRSKP